MKLIRNCKDCGFFRYTNATNYHFKGAAICSYRSKKLESPYEVPVWCHLENTPNQTEYCKDLEKLNSLIMGPSLIEDAYSIDVIQRNIFIRYYNKAYAGLELIKSQGDFLACKYANWKIFIKQVA